MRDWFHNGSVEIPDDPELEVDLTGPEYGFSSKNQIHLELKEDMTGVIAPDDMPNNNFCRYRSRIGNSSFPQRACRIVGKSSHWLCRRQASVPIINSCQHTRYVVTS